MRLRVIFFALVATAVAVGLVLPTAGAKPPSQSKSRQGRASRRRARQGIQPLAERSSGTTRTANS
jgi:hypothetical protein